MTTDILTFIPFTLEDYSSDLSPKVSGASVKHYIKATLIDDEEHLEHRLLEVMSREIYYMDVD
jgi:hypothetical protein